MNKLFIISGDPEKAVIKSGDHKKIVKKVDNLSVLCT